MSVIYLPKGSIMSWNANDITEHNRKPVSIDVERIEKSNRMANGTLRKWVIADKRTFSVTWDNLPHSAAYTVDNKWAGREIESFYNTHAGLFVLQIKESGTSTPTSYNVVFTNFTKSIEKRGIYDFWNISITMEEV